MVERETGGAGLGYRLLYSIPVSGSRKPRPVRDISQSQNLFEGNENKDKIESTESVVEFIVTTIDLFDV